MKYLVIAGLQFVNLVPFMSFPGAVFFKVFATILFYLPLLVFCFGVPRSKLVFGLYIGFWQFIHSFINISDGSIGFYFYLLTIANGIILALVFLQKRTTDNALTKSDDPVVEPEDDSAHSR
ncbi:MAG: hypothetical protein HRU19_27610 [Pseudobacteriovorax sp.]|nr:hypothetical protein [Pseudobacteriovorax sp.]